MNLALLHVSTIADAFVYVGPDEDAFSLNLLKPSEDRILYIEPLITWRNFPRIQQLRREPASDPINVERLFDCEEDVQPLRIHPKFSTCVDPLTMANVDEYVQTFTENMLATARCNAPHANGMRDLRIVSSNATIRRFDMVFISAGVPRALTVLFDRIQNVDLAVHLGRHAISTLSILGISHQSARAALSKLCQLKHRADHLRLIAARTKVSKYFMLSDKQTQLKFESSASRNPTCCAPSSLRQQCEMERLNHPRKKPRMFCSLLFGMCDLHMFITNPQIPNVSTSYELDTNTLSCGRDMRGWGLQFA